uniref:Uncharacterized protein n=1 Tax=Nelumbo nucifera TaxID=4432 RepID=A0A822Z697_NELNU|nr:TPA_asm: hypothetical protein HUJ06_014680 [Nelumbo nucifera]
MQQRLREELRRWLRVFSAATKGIFAYWVRLDYGYFWIELTRRKKNLGHTLNLLALKHPLQFGLVADEIPQLWHPCL